MTLSARKHQHVTGWHLTDDSFTVPSLREPHHLAPGPKPRLIDMVETGIGGHLCRVQYQSPSDGPDSGPWVVQWQMAAPPILARAARRMALHVHALCPPMDPVVRRYLKTGREDLLEPARLAVASLPKPARNSAQDHALSALRWALNPHAWESVPETSRAAQRAVLADETAKGLINPRSRRSVTALLGKVRIRHNRILTGITTALHYRQQVKTG